MIAYSLVRPCLAALALLPSVAAAEARRPGAMLGWFATAVLADPLAALFAPFVIGIGIRLRAGPRLLVGAVPVAWAVVMALHRDAPLALAAGGPSLWALVETGGLAQVVPLPGLAVTLAVGTAFALGARLSTTGGACPARAAALLTALSVPAATPGMPLAAFAPALLLSLSGAAVTRTQETMREALLVATGCAAAWLGAPAIGTLSILVAIALLIPALRDPAANDNLPMGHLIRLEPADDRAASW